MTLPHCKRESCNKFLVWRLYPVIHWFFEPYETWCLVSCILFHNELGRFNLPFVFDDAFDFLIHIFKVSYVLKYHIYWRLFILEKELHKFGKLFLVRGCFLCNFLQSFSTGASVLVLLLKPFISSNNNLLNIL